MAGSKVVKDIPKVLKLFGLHEQDAPYFISPGTGIATYPEEDFRADFYIYGICISGTAEISLNNERVLLKPRSFFAAIPSTIVRVHGHAQNFKAKILVFQKGFLLRNILDSTPLEHLGFFNFNTLVHLSLSKEEIKLLLPKLDTIYEKAGRKSPFSEQIMQTLILNLLYETAEIFFRHREQSIKKALTRQEELFIRFIKFVSTHFRTNREVSFYAQKLFLSRKYLSIICKEVSGKTPGDIIQEVAINEAKLLLKMPGNNVSAVSQALHYGSVAAFSKFFTKNTGLSPSAFKMQE
ncbi:MAG: AraC family transcriptional regulator [Niabella sp.]